MKPLKIETVSAPQPGAEVIPQPVSLPVEVKKVAPKEPRSAGSVWVLRFILLFAILGSASLVYWSFSKRLQTVSNELKEKTAEMTRVADEIERLRFKWGPQQIEETKAEYSKAKDALLDGEEDMAQWRKTVASEGSMRVLELVEKPGESFSHAILTNEVSIVPVTLTVQPLPILVTTNTPYSRVDGFADSITRNTEKRYDLVSLTVDGNSNP
ncbi:MAG TPA: hypothetical protein VM735_10935, partial [Candidatus Kapabacteria bacterium]|nr:hypothetical protein [Candidatus Kapabacteria bacterium]